MDFLKPYPYSISFLAICALLCLLSLQLLHKDLNPGKWDSAEFESGKVLKATSSVKRKSQSSLLWNPLSEKNHLFENDSILVGPNSSVEFELNGGVKVELRENSFFVVVPNTKADHSLKRGTLVLTEGTERTLLESQEDGSIKKTQLEAKLEAPVHNSEFILIDKKNRVVEFEWSLLADKEKNRVPLLQVSTDEIFQSNLIEKKAASYVLPLGTYFWRVVLNDEAISEVRSFTIRKMETVQLTKPAKNENIARVDFNLPLTFNWKPVSKNTLSPGREDFLQVAEEDQFKKITYENPVSPLTGLSEVKILKEGTYFWRILSKITGEIKISSEVRPFHLSQTENLSITLLNPSENTVLRKPAGILFNWKENRVEAEYFLEVVDFATKKSVFSGSVKGTALNWNKPMTGTFLWRVSAKNALKPIAASDWRVLSLIHGNPISLISPKESESILFWKKTPAFEFAWEKSPSAFGYVLEFSESKSFNKVLSSEVSANASVPAANLTLPLGNLFWRVRAVDEEQVTLNISEARELHYDQHPTLRAPANFAPSKGTVWDVIKEGKDLLIQWEAVPEAKHYEINISGKSMGTFSTRVSTTELLLKRFKAGLYKVSVSAVDELGRTGSPLGPIELSVHYSDLKAPAIEEPEIK